MTTGQLRSLAAFAAVVCLLQPAALHGEDSGGGEDAGRHPIKAHHERLRFECEDCHGDGPVSAYQPLGTEDCLACHGSYELIADRTADLGYYGNIHAAPHYPKLDCGLCHQEHDGIERNYCVMYDRKCESENYCVMCHSQETMLELQVP